MCALGNAWRAFLRFVMQLFKPDISPSVPVGVVAYAQTPTGTLGNAYNIVKFGTITTDTDSAYSTSTGLFTVPASKGGWYTVTFDITINATWSAGQINQIAMYINGAAKNYFSATAIAAAAGTDIMSSGSFNFLLVAGDTLGFYSNVGTAVSPTFSTSNSNFSILKA